MLKFDKAIYSAFVFKFVFSERLSINISQTEVLLFLEFINIISIFALQLSLIPYIFIYISAFSFAWWKEYTTWSVWFHKFSDVFSDFIIAMDSYR